MRSVALRPGQATSALLHPAAEVFPSMHAQSVSVSPPWLSGGLAHRDGCIPRARDRTQLARLNGSYSSRGSLEPFTRAVRDASSLPHGYTAAKKTGAQGI